MKKRILVSMLVVFSVMLTGCGGGGGDGDDAADVNIITTIMPNAIQNKEYSENIEIAGGQGNYTVTVISGDLPTGLNLGTAGTVSGVAIDPLAIYTFTVRAQDRDLAENYDEQQIIITVKLMGSDDYEPNDDFNTDNTITSDGVSQTHTIDKDGQDCDYIKLDLTGEGNQTLKIQTYSASIPTDTLLRIYDADGELLVTDDNAGTDLYSRIEYDFSAGVYFIMISAADGEAGDYRISVMPAISITTQGLPFCIQGEAYSAQIAASGGVQDAEYSFSVVSGNLPADLSLASDGTISGTPTGAVGTYGFTVQVEDKNNVDNHTSKELSIDVQLTTADNHEPNDDFNTENTIRFDGTKQTHTIDKDGDDCDYIKLDLTGKGNQTLKIQTYSASIPTDTLLRIYDADGELLVTDDNAGTDLYSKIEYDFTDDVFYIMVSAADGEPGDYIISVQPAISITTESLPESIQNEAYTAQIVAVGGVADTEYDFSVVSGNLPTNVSLSGDGTISGTPTGAVGSYIFTVRAEDENDVDNYTSKEFCIDVELTGADDHEEKSDDDFETENTIIYEDMMDDGIEQSHTIDKRGRDHDYIKLDLTGEGNQRFKIQTYFESIPTDTLLRIYDASGQLLATDDNSGSDLYSRIVYDFTDDVFYIMVSAADGEPGDYIISVKPAISITTESLPESIQNEAYTAQIVAAGGVADTEYDFSVVSGNLPTNVSLSPDGNISGRPTGAVGTYKFTVHVEDENDADNYTSKQFSLNVELTGGDQYEPDDDFETENTISYDDIEQGVEQSHTIDKRGRDHDYIKLDLTGEGNQRFKIQTYFESIPTDTLLRIYDASGQLLATDDNSGSDLYSRIVYDFTDDVFYIMVSAADGEPGDYIISVKPAISITTRTLRYCIQNEAYTAQIVAAGGVRDTEYSFSLVSGNLPENLSLSPDGTISGTPTGIIGTYRFTVHVEDENDIDNYTAKEIALALQLTGADNYEEESDDDFGTENTMSYDSVEQSHTIDHGDDQDYIKLDLTNISIDTKVLIETGFVSFDTDTLLRIYDANGEVLVTDDNSGSGLYSKIEYDFTEGVYFVMISTADGRPGDYVISVKLNYRELEMVHPTTLLIEGFAGESYCDTMKFEGGTGCYVYSLIGSLPEGLNLDTSTGEVSGTLDATTHDVYSFDVMVSDLYYPDYYSTQKNLKLPVYHGERGVDDGYKWVVWDTYQSFSGTEWFGLSMSWDSKVIFEDVPTDENDMNRTSIYVDTDTTVDHYSRGEFIRKEYDVVMEGPPGDPKEPTETNSYYYEVWRCRYPK
jgi:hypothetical protein